MLLAWGQRRPFHAFRFWRGQLVHTHRSASAGGAAHTGAPHPQVHERSARPEHVGSHRRVVARRDSTCIGGTTTRRSRRARHADPIGR
eukprot:11124827-Heterocapsa_arctica.AAC.1